MEKEEIKLTIPYADECEERIGNIIVRYMETGKLVKTDEDDEKLLKNY